MKRGFRVLALAAAAAVALMATPALAAESPTYLALGDSYAFGFNPLLDPTDATNFVSYANYLAQRLNLGMTNAACPGETSASMISGTPPDNGCHEHYPPLPLHVAYTGSQLTFAVTYLGTHSNTRLVTIQIGGNDLLLVLPQLNACNANPLCVAGILGPLEIALAGNLNFIYGTIRSTAQYSGNLVVVPYFSLNYADANGTAIAASLDHVIAIVADAYGAKVADVFDAFAKASAPFGGSPCLAGLQVELPSGGCDIHPSLKGQRLIAKTIQAVLRGDDPED